MLKAVQTSQYVNKNRNTVLVYTVTGPTAEIAEYMAIQSATLNKPVDQLAKDKNGNPLMWVNLQTEFQNGRVPQPSYFLVKSHDGLRYIRDTVQQDVAMYQRVNQQKEVEMGKALALRALGLDGQPTTRPATTTAPTGTPAPEKQPDTIADEIAALASTTVPAEAGAEATGGTEEL